MSVHSYLQGLASVDTFHSGNAIWSTISGDRIEQYQLGKTLGHGEFGKVKKCVDTDTGDIYAVKVIKKALLEKARMTDQFCREISALVSLGNHDHIVRLVDLLQTDEHYFVVMELVQGGDLVERLTVNAQTVQLNEGASRRYFQQIVSAVAYMHANGICHRDIKLENIMLDEADNIRMLDFGFCNAQAEGGRLMTVCGSIDYSAPEVVTSQRSTMGYDGFAADVWSLGCLLYVLLCGRLPFRGATLQDTMHRLSNCQMAIPSHLSEEGIQLLHAMLKVSPKDRLTIKGVMDHPWTKYGWNDNVQFKMDEEQKKLTHQFASIRKARQGHHAMNAFEIISDLTSDNINALVMESYIGTASRHFMCRGTPQSVGQRLIEALKVAQGNPESTKKDATEISGYVCVATGVVVFRVTVTMMIGHDLVMVAIHRLRGTAPEFVDYCRLLSVQLGDILVTKGTALAREPSLNAFELLAVLNHVDMTGLLQQHDLMKTNHRRDELFLLQMQKLDVNQSITLATCTQHLLAILRDKLSVTAFSDGEWSLVGFENSQPILTFGVHLYLIPQVVGRVLVRVEIGQGHITNFKAFLLKLSDVLAAYK